MDLNELVNRLQLFDLSLEEGRLYLHLLKVKSATIGEIHGAEEFKGKQRTNLYKIINRLKDKKFIVEEEKNLKKQFYPIPPQTILNYIVDRKEQELVKLRDIVETLTTSLEELVSYPAGFESNFTPEVLEFVNMVNPRWIVREKPQILEEKGLGKITSIEFNTLRKFSGDSAGIIVHSFRYPEHVSLSFDNAREFILREQRKALDSMIGQGPIHLKKYWLEETEMNHKGIPKGTPFTEIKAKLNIPSTASGGFTIFRVKEHPKRIVSVWGADLRDFVDLLERFCRNYTLFFTKE